MQKSKEEIIKDLEAWIEKEKDNPILLDRLRPVQILYNYSMMWGELELLKQKVINHGMEDSLIEDLPTETFKEVYNIDENSELQQGITEINEEFEIMENGQP